MIKTFIFLDLETTGLITKNYMPKITEMSLIAVSRTAICNTTNISPRILQKLVLPIHPDVPISKDIQKLTGLSNENLKEFPCFNHDIYNLVVNFINRLAAPACFIAYNGNNYDYPIFLSEFKNIEKSFSENVLSIDMMHLVKEFFSCKQNPRKEMNIVQPIAGSSDCTEVSILLNDGYDKILSDALDSIMDTNLNDHNKNNTPTKIKETTVHLDSVFNTPQTSYCKTIQKINEKTPENQIIKLQHCNENFQDRRGSNVKRQLNFTNNRPINFRLGSVYKHIFGNNPEDAHSAEGDCLTMIRCAIKLGNFFVEWADCNAVPITNYTSK
ncbi:uncharacterized protein [Bombus flavifrons]|uniref:uncharacterized protein isoform X1 n=1 Tax=Bombus flavifrons TaxID=103934 RepID=UPI003704562E